jgi:ribosome-associated protein
MLTNFAHIIQHIIDHEIFFQFTKSSGKGGQNVNKRETKAELYFDIALSTVLSAKQKQRIMKHAHPYMHGTLLIMTCQEERYQGANKKKVLDRF